MKVYIIQNEKEGTTYYPYVTCSKIVAKRLAENDLKKMGYETTIIEYEIITQGKNRLSIGIIKNIE